MMMMVMMVTIMIMMMMAVILTAINDGDCRTMIAAMMVMMAALTMTMAMSIAKKVVTMMLAGRMARMMISTQDADGDHEAHYGACAVHYIAMGMHTDTLTGIIDINTRRTEAPGS